MSTNISAKRLADFIAAVQEHETLLMQRLRDLEAVGVLENVTPNKEGIPQFPRVSTLEPEMEAHSQDDEQLPPLQNNVELLDLTRLPILGEYR